MGILFDLHPACYKLLPNLGFQQSRQYFEKIMFYCLLFLSTGLVPKIDYLISVFHTLEMKNKGSILITAYIHDARNLNILDILTQLVRFFLDVGYTSYTFHFSYEHGCSFQFSIFRYSCRHVWFSNIFLG